MSTNSEKIFIDNDEELTFILDRILESDQPNVSLIIEKHSLLTSSLINLKALASICAKNKKNIVLVTTSELALEKQAAVPLMCVKHMSDINPSVWEQAAKYSTTILAEEENTKNHLLALRKESRGEQITPAAGPNIELTAKDAELLEGITSGTGLTESLDEENDLPDMDDLNPVVAHELDVAHGEAENENLEPALKKPKRLEPKVVEKFGIKLVAGGDIKQMIQTGQLELDKPKAPDKDLNLKIGSTARDDFEKDKTQFSDEEELKSKKKHKNVLEGVLAGGPALLKKFKKMGGPPKPPQYKNQTVANSVGDSQIRSRKRKTKLNYPRIIFVGTLALCSYLIMARFVNTTKISITPSNLDISISEQAIASTNAEAIDFQRKLVPLKRITAKSSESGSAVAESTGEIGQKATGVVDITNKTAEQVSLPSGTILTTLTDNLQFELLQDIKIPARFSDITFATYENAPIRAIEFGTKFNTEPTDVKVGEFSTVNQLSGRIYKQTSGGTQETVTIVGQTDVDELKAELEVELKDTLEKQLKIKLNSDDIAIEDSKKYREASLVVDPPVGQKAQEFEITTYELEATMDVFNSNNLEELAKAIITQTHGENVELNDQKSATKAYVDEVREIGDGEYNFVLKKSAAKISDFNGEQLLEEIGGKNIAEVNQILATNDNIEEFNVRYGPFPTFNMFKRISGNSSATSIEITE